MTIRGLHGTTFFGLAQPVLVQARPGPLPLWKN